MGIPESNQIRAENTQIEVTLYQQSGQRANVTIEIDTNFSQQEESHVFILKVTRYRRLAAREPSISESPSVKKKGYSATW